MIIQRLDVNAVRNLQALRLHLSRLNLFHGLNGSGKSSLLEAVHVLGLGRSFRTTQPKKWIQYEQARAVVFAELVSGQQLAISKHIDGTQLLKANGNAVQSVAELAYDLPIQLIHPEGMDLLDGGSKPRRQLLDWLVFHVEHGYHRVWLRYQRALAQRNALLKQQGSDSEWHVWENELIQAGLLLHQQRQQVFNNWLFFVQNACEVLLPSISISLEYVAGFDPQADLAAIFVEQRQRDRERGHTQLGPHRADLRIKTEHGLVEYVLSRGQKKLLICALRLAQVAYLRTYVNKTCLVLLDDLASELDELARGRLLQCLYDLQAQVLMTAVEADNVWPQLQAIDKTAKLFHVEHGIVTPQ